VEGPRSSIRSWSSNATSASSRPATGAWRRTGTTCACCSPRRTGWCERVPLPWWG